MAEQPRSEIIGADFERLVTEYNKALANGEARPISAIQCDGAEASSCASEQTFRKLLDAFPAPVYTTDAAGRITFYNEAAVKFSGRQARLGTDRCTQGRPSRPGNTGCRGTAGWYARSVHPSSDPAAGCFGRSRRRRQHAA